jgi:hypothetical protein
MAAEADEQELQSLAHLVCTNASPDNGFTDWDGLTIVQVRLGLLHYAHQGVVRGAGCEQDFRERDTVLPDR